MTKDGFTVPTTLDDVNETGCVRIRPVGSKRWKYGSPFEGHYPHYMGESRSRSDSPKPHDGLYKYELDGGAVIEFLVDCVPYGIILAGYTQPEIAKKLKILSAGRDFDPTKRQFKEPYEMQVQR